MSDMPLDRPPLTDAQRVIMRTWSKINNGTARSWSHAMGVAADSLKKPDDESSRVSPRLDNDSDTRP